MIREGYGKIHLEHELKAAKEEIRTLKAGDTSSSIMGQNNLES
jgi:hypothetical protein